MFISSFCSISSPFISSIMKIVEKIETAHKWKIHFPAWRKQQFKSYFFRVLKYSSCHFQVSHTSTDVCCVHACMLVCICVPFATLFWYASPLSHTQFIIYYLSHICTRMKSTAGGASICYEPSSVYHTHMCVCVRVHVFYYQNRLSWLNHLENMNGASRVSAHTYAGAHTQT